MSFTIIAHMQVIFIGGGGGAVIWPENRDYEFPVCRVPPSPLWKVVRLDTYRHIN